MATVPDKANTAGAVVDRKLATPNRNNAGTPVGALTPAYGGEVVLDTTNGITYVSTGITNADWMPFVRELGC